MNASDPGSNITSASLTEPISLPPLTTTSPTMSHPAPVPSDSHNPEFTIMVVLGLSLLLAGVAAFLAVCRSSDQEGDSDEACGPGESLPRGRALSSEPQLKVWRRLGSYRRSYNISFRRPQYRQPAERPCSRASQSPPARQALQALQAEGGADPHLTMACLFDYVTEI